MILTYQELIDAEPFECWPLYQLPDGRMPGNTGNEHSAIGGTSKVFAAVDTMYPKKPGEHSEGQWSAPGQAGVVSPCWGYLSSTRDYTDTNTGAQAWLNILLHKPPPVPLPGQPWDDGWHQAATGWRFKLGHLSELYVAKRQVIPPGFLCGRLMDLKEGKPFVPHVHSRLRPLSLNTNVDPDGVYDPRPLYHSGIVAIEEGWTWDETRGMWIDPNDAGIKILSILDDARAKIAGLLA